MVNSSELPSPEHWVHSPRILLADEPTGNLDSSTAEQVEDLLTELCLESAVTFVMVTHNIQLAHRISDRRFSMSDGVLTEMTSNDYCVTLGVWRLITCGSDVAEQL